MLAWPASKANPVPVPSTDDLVKRLLDVVAP
jgi:hypothetical protein